MISVGLDISFIKHDGLIGSVILVLTFYTENKRWIAVGKVDIVGIDRLCDSDAGCQFFVCGSQFLNGCAVVSVDAESDCFIRKAITCRSFLFFEIVATPGQVFDGQCAVSTSSEITKILAGSRIQRINSAFEFVGFTFVIFGHDDTSLFSGVDDIQLYIEIGRRDLNFITFGIGFIIIGSVSFFQYVRTPFQVFDLGYAGFVCDGFTYFLFVLVIQCKFNICNLIANIVVFDDGDGSLLAGILGCNGDGMIAIFV